MSQPTQDKKIIIDDDWKQEAEREKAALAAEMEKAKARGPAVPDAATLSMLLSGLASQALVSLGDLPNPFTGKPDANLAEARFQIDLIEMLEAKTKGNTTPEEQQLLTGLLYDLRMRYLSKISAPPAGKA